jgi:hypothetical protein
MPIMSKPEPISDAVNMIRELEAEFLGLEMSLPEDKEYGVFAVLPNGRMLQVARIGALKGDLIRLLCGETDGVESIVFVHKSALQLLCEIKTKTTAEPRRRPIGFEGLRGESIDKEKPH